MLVIVVFRVWDRDSDPVSSHQPLKAAQKNPEKITSHHENSINIDAPVLSSVRRKTNRHKSEKVQKSALFVDLFLDLAKVSSLLFF